MTPSSENTRIKSSRITRKVCHCDVGVGWFVADVISVELALQMKEGGRFQASPAGEPPDRLLVTLRAGGRLCLETQSESPFSKCLGLTPALES